MAKQNQRSCSTLAFYAASAIPISVILEAQGFYANASRHTMPAVVMSSPNATFNFPGGKNSE
ncbi:MAG: hypothetical protein J5944_01205 [Lentisphaeria bacterium]|jgi:hypothetical protein|nr:hypothetical protein [Lentisphaeria bacterium]